jgi:hypothetical protein
VGKLIYGSQDAEFEFEDRLLAHLRVVIVTKLRRRENFTFTWDYPTSNGSGRMSLWMDAAIPLQFRFYGGREPSLNRAWIEALSGVAASTMGLVPLPEPQSGDAPQT